MEASFIFISQIVYFCDWSDASVSVGNVSPTEFGDNKSQECSSHDNNCFSLMVKGYLYNT